MLLWMNEHESPQLLLQSRSGKSSQEIKAKEELNLEWDVQQGHMGVTDGCPQKFGYVVYHNAHNRTQYTGYNIKGGYGCFFCFVFVLHFIQYVNIY